MNRGRASCRAAVTDALGTPLAGAVACALAALSATAACARDGAPSGSGDPPPPVLRITHGVAAGDLAPDAVSLWARASGRGTLNFELSAPGEPARRLCCEVRRDSDFTGSVRFERLAPHTDYTYRAWVTDVEQPTAAASVSSEGRFRSPPAPATAAGLRLAWGADLAGQNVCRHQSHGFPVFEGLAANEPEVLLTLGDMIYADGVCTDRDPWGEAQVAGHFPQATRLEDFRGHWRYAREDPGFRRLLAQTSWMFTWDDHEVVNDFGPADDSRSAAPYRIDLHLMPLGEQAIREYVPLRPGRSGFERRLRWGQHAELFVLDLRRHRDPNSATDSGSRPKTMLGDEQRRWLVEGLAASRATWKLVASSVPLSIPTGHGCNRDGWADYDCDTGFEHELRALVDELHARRVKNLIFLSADLHLATVLSYRPIAADAEYVLHEAVSGPLNAWVFPEPRLDAELWPERLFYFAPDYAATSYEQARRYFNFGMIEIAPSGALALSIRNTRGEAEYRLSLTAAAPD